MIIQYFVDFGNLVNSLDFVNSCEIHHRKINDFLGIIEGKIQFECGILDFVEVIKLNDNQLSKTKYSYHFRSLLNEMIFRYDNAPHHQYIATFPHHKHSASGITECNKPDISQIVAEIKTYSSATNQLNK